MLIGQRSRRGARPVSREQACCSYTVQFCRNVWDGRSTGVVGSQLRLLHTAPACLGPARIVPSVHHQAPLLWSNRRAAKLLEWHQTARRKATSVTSAAL